MAPGPTKNYLYRYKVSKHQEIIQSHFGPYDHITRVAWPMRHKGHIRLHLTIFRRSNPI